MIKKIVTHPGGAHKDDLLAVCVLVAAHGVPVVRRVPTDTELDEPEIAVVDIGGSDDSSRSNFDHHLYPRNHEPTCALSLVLKHLGLYEDARQFCDWLEPAEWLDSRGPNKTAQWLGVPRKVISQLNSPIDVTLLRRFGQETELAEGSTLYEYMRFVGQDLVDYLRLAREGIDFVKNHSERWSIPLGDDIIEVVFLPRTDPPTAEPSTGVNNYILAEGLEKTVAALVAAALANRVLKKTDRIDDLPDARRPEPAGRDLLPSQRAHVTGARTLMLNATLHLVAPAI